MCETKYSTFFKSWNTILSKPCPYSAMGQCHLTTCPRRPEHTRRGSHTHDSMTTTSRFWVSTCKRHRGLEGCQCKPQVYPSQCWSDPYLHAFQPKLPCSEPSPRKGTTEHVFAPGKRTVPTALLKQGLLKHQPLISSLAGHFFK